MCSGVNCPENVVELKMKSKGIIVIVFNQVLRHNSVWRGVDLYFHVFLTSVLVGDEWSASRPDRFSPGNI
jgi:hypothetical protein